MELPSGVGRRHRRRAPTALVLVIPVPRRAEADVAGVPRRAPALVQQPLLPDALLVHAVVARAEAVAGVLVLVLALALALAQWRPQPPPERPPATVDDAVPEAEQPQRVRRPAAQRPRQPRPGRHEARALAAVMDGEAAPPVAEPRQARAVVLGTASA